MDDFWRRVLADSSDAAALVTMVDVGAMVLLFAVMLVRLLFPIWWRAHTYRRVRRNLPRVTPGSDTERRAAAEKIAGLRFGERSIFRWVERFHREWGEAAIERHGRRRSTWTVQDSFPAPGPLPSQTATAIARALPGIFLALGILGTFVGLVIGLGGMRTDTPEGLWQSVQQVMGGMNAAFLTSIAGILASLAWSFLEWGSRGTVMKAFRRMLAALDQAYPTVHPGELTRWHFELQEENRDNLKQIGVDLGTQLAGAVEKHLAPKIEQMARLVENLSTNISEQQAGAVERIVESFLGRLNDAVADQHERLAKSAQDICQAQERTIKSTETILDRFEKAAQAHEQSLARTREILAPAEQVIERMTEVHRSLSELARGMSAVTDGLRASAGDLRAACGERVDQEQQAARAFDARLALMHGSIDEARDFWRGQGEALQRLADSLAHATRDFGDALNAKVREVFATFDHELSVAVDRMNGTLHGLDETVAELPGLLDNLRSTVAGELAPAAEALAGAASALPEVTEKLADTLGNHVPAVLEKAAKFAEELAGSANSFARGTGALRTAIDQTLPERLNEQLERIAEAIGEPIGALNARLVAFSRGIGDVLNTPILNLERLLGGFPATLSSELTRPFQELDRRLQGVAAELGDLHAALAGAREAGRVLERLETKLPPALPEAITTSLGQLHTGVTRLHTALLDLDDPVRKTAVGLTQALDGGLHGQVTRIGDLLEMALRHGGSAAGAAQEAAAPPPPPAAEQDGDGAGASPPSEPQPAPSQGRWRLFGRGRAKDSEP